MKAQDALPVLLSIVVIVLVAVVEKQSKLIAAITATMPIGASLALWIVYSANDGNQETMERFGLGLLLGLMPTMGFLVAAWLAARAGLKLIPMYLVGYGVWGVGVALLLVLRRALGV
jgi:uncharacterized membrane protein (GlpM family)